MKKENWIKWDLDSRLGFKMASFFSEYGALGYGIFVLLIEQLYRSEDHKLPLDEKAIQNYTKLYKCIQKDFCMILYYLIECGLFKSDDKFFWSPRVLAESQESDSKAKDISKKRQVAVNTRWKKQKEENKTEVDFIQTDTNAYKPIQTHTKSVDESRLDKNINFTNVKFNKEINKESFSESEKSKKTKPKKIHVEKYSNFCEADFKFPPKWSTNSKQALKEWVEFKTQQGTAKLLMSYQKEVDSFADNPKVFYQLVARAIAKNWKGLNEHIAISEADQKVVLNGNHQGGKPKETNFDIGVKTTKWLREMEALKDETK